MTNEEAIKIIYQEIHDTKIQGEKYAFLKKSCDKECEALTMAIKALEQANALDKAREEIVHLHDWAFSRDEILRIIDRCKAESEDKNKTNER